jgi:hypothetical protein
VTPECSLCGSPPIVESQWRGPSLAPDSAALPPPQRATTRRTGTVGPKRWHCNPFVVSSMRSETSSIYMRKRAQYNKVSYHNFRDITLTSRTPSVSAICSFLPLSQTVRNGPHQHLHLCGSPYASASASRTTCVPPPRATTSQNR